MATKIFVTGLSSKLMGSFCDLIDIDEYEITGLSRVCQLQSPYNWVKGDLKSLIKNPKLLAGTDILIHAASITHSFNESDYVELNFEQTKQLVSIAHGVGVKKLVYISTRAVGKKAGGYGKSKLLAENYIKNNFPNWLIFRPSEIFGGSKNEGIDKLIDDCLNKNLMVYPGGGPPLYPISVDDVVKLMYHRLFVEEVKNKILTINGPKPFTYKQIIERVGSIKGSRILKIPIPKPLMYLIKYFMRLTKVKFGIVPDQVDRFYAPKGHTNIDFDFDLLEEYIKNKNIINDNKLT